MRRLEFSLASGIGLPTKRGQNAPSVERTTLRRIFVLPLAALSVAAAALAQTVQEVHVRPPVQSTAALLGPAPDLRVTRFLVTKVECNEPLCLKVHVEMRNFGEGTKGQVEVRLSYKTKYENPWAQLETFHFAPQAHNHDTAAGKLFSFRESGDYCFLAEIDPENKVQPAAATKTAHADCRHYDAGIPDPALLEVKVSRCQHDNTDASHCFGTRILKNAGDGKLDGTIKFVMDCSTNGKSFKKCGEWNEKVVCSAGERGSGLGWVVVIGSKDVQTLRCRLTLYPTMRERSSANNSITSDLWRKP
jgi:hypothetical protein